LDSVQPIGKFLKDALNSFNNKKPDIIIIYRDGVAESQLDDVSDKEIEQVIEALYELNIKKEEIDLIYSVIQKRIHVRFLAKGSDNKFYNPPPGLVTEDGSIKYEGDNASSKSFYLIPTLCDLSTVKPVNFIMIQKEGVRNTISDRDFQNYTYFMCFLYPNWTDSIKTPFVTMMAHKSSYTLGESLPPQQSIIHDFLKRKLFFL